MGAAFASKHEDAAGACSLTFAFLGDPVALDARARELCAQPVRLPEPAGPGSSDTTEEAVCGEDD